MIFRQVREIVEGTKTQTRRILNPGVDHDGHDLGLVFAPGGRIKWVVGRDYAVVPKMGYHGCHYDIENGTIYGHGYEPLGEASKAANIIVPLRIKLLGFRAEPLQAISRQDAIAEGMTGVSPVGDYRKLWEQINGVGSWDKNPAVWVIDFEVLK